MATKKTTSKKGSSHPKNIDGFKRPTRTKDSVPVSVAETDVTIVAGDFPADEQIESQHGQDNGKLSEPAVEEDISVAEVTTSPETAEENITIAAVATDSDIAEDTTSAKVTTDSETEEDIAIAAVTTEPEIAAREIEDQDIEDLINDAANQSLDQDTKNPQSTPKETKKMKKAPKKARPYRIISRILAIVSTLALGAFITYAALSNAIPFKYITIAIGVAVLFSGFYLFKSFRKKTHLSVLTILNILGIILSAASVFGFLKFNELLSFLDQNLGGSDVEYSVYNVIVSKKSLYDNLDSVKGQEFHSISDFIDTEKLEKAVKEQADGTVIYVDGITSLLQNSINNSTYISLLNSGTWDATTEADEDKIYVDNLKIIAEIKVPVEKSTRSSSANVTKDSWTMYISGIDTRSGMMVDRSLSDVNIVMAINPNTKNILMVAIPRDYYVQLHGTSGLPDKLTHAGSLGGIELSMATIDDILGININQYLRVNFNAVIGLVDAIGGITVNSDVDYSFRCHTNNNCTINPGLNNLDGACALAFARERYAYSSGDRHRGENQEQVIEKIFEKVSSSTTLISKYSDILQALSGSFETSLTTSDITSLVNMQLNDMAKWTISTYNLNGTTGGAYTYSYPSQTLSVMFPDQSTIDTAKQKIKAVLEGAN